MQTLNQFVKEQIDDIEAFRAFWIEQNRREGKDKFPLVFQDGNEGAWFEQFTAFLESKPENK